MGKFDFVKSLMAKFDAGSFGQLLQAGFGDIGAILASPFKAAGAKITTVFSNVGKLIINGPLGKIISFFGGIAGKIATLFAPIGNLLGAIFGPLAGLFGSLLGAAAPIVGIVLAVMAVISAIHLLMGNLGSVRGFIANTFGEGAAQVFDGFVASVQNIWQTIKGVFSDENIGKARGFIQNTFGGKAVSVFDAFISIARTVGGVIGELIHFAITYVEPILVKIFDFIVNTALPAIADAFVQWAPTISGIISGLSEAIMGVIHFLVEVFNVAWPSIKDAVMVAIEAIGTVVGGLLTTLQGVIDFVVGIFTGDWERAWEGVKNVFKGIFDSLGGIVKGAMNLVISGVNVAIRGVNKVAGKVPVLGGAVNIPEIPMFAKGSNYSPDTFIAGEEGAELITNAKGRKIFTALQTQGIARNMRDYLAMAEYSGRAARAERGHRDFKFSKGGSAAESRIIIQDQRKIIMATGSKEEYDMAERALVSGNDDLARKMKEIDRDMRRLKHA